PNGQCPTSILPIFDDFANLSVVRKHLLIVQTMRVSADTNMILAQLLSHLGKPLGIRYGRRPDIAETPKGPQHRLCAQFSWRSVTSTAAPSTAPWTSAVWQS